MNISEQIGRECSIHGQRWNEMHDGYFSDTAVALPLIEKISKHLGESRPGIIVDLGGGTGFILQELMRRGALKDTIPVNLDCSPTQLDAVKKSGISCMNGTISDFMRNNIADKKTGKKIFFIMRSVLHYFGKGGLIPILSHIRSQAEEGEIFINQSACFENEPDARCANALYRRMGTPKWYPVAGELREYIAAAGWRLIDECPAPPLKLSSAELGQRYGIAENILTEIRGGILEDFGETDNVFRAVPDGFVAYLHYRIFVARAA